MDTEVGWPVRYWDLDAAMAVMLMLLTAVDEGVGAWWFGVFHGAAALLRDLGVRSPLAAGDPSLALGTSTMTLMELTAAYAGVAGNSFPVEPTAFKAAEQGWFGRLFDGRSSLSRREHAAIEHMLAELKRLIAEIEE